MRIRALTLAFAMAALFPVVALASDAVDPAGTAAQPGIAAGAAGTTVAAGSPGLIGSWFDGSISSIQFYDPISGSFADPNGEGFYFIFDADGTYREGAVISSTQYTCTMRLLGENQGTWTINGTFLTMAQSGGSVSITNTCGDSGVYAQGVKQAVYRWSIGPDDYGTETLSLAMDDGSPYGRFHRWID